MEIRTLHNFVLLLALAFGLFACQGVVLRPPPQDEPAPVAQEPPLEEEPVIPPPPDNLSASRRVKQALHLLEQGDYEKARMQLAWALVDKPGLQIAESLVEQIDANPVDYLGVKNFYYKVESGDSLSIIAGKFLDDPMMFVILARYNQLENPSKLAPGDRIRVPGAMPEEVWRKPKKKTKRRASKSGQPPSGRAQPDTAKSESTAATETGLGKSDDASADEKAVEGQPSQTTDAETAKRPPSLEQVLGTARTLHDGGDLSGAIAQLENEGGRYAHTKALQSLQIGYYREYSEQLVSEGELERARNILEKMVLLDAEDEQAINRLIKVEDKLEAERLYQLGSDLLSNDQVDNAYQMFSQALTYDPQHTQASQAQQLCRDRLTDNYHRQAMRHFRQQELDEAIVLWNRILELNPGHSLAPGYKARALEMQQKLQQIESK
jgi:tetratricopeptide (TPR) repeat protein